MKKVIFGLAAVAALGAVVVAHGAPAHGPTDGEESTIAATIAALHGDATEAGSLADAASDTDGAVGASRGSSAVEIPLEVRGGRLVVPVTTADGRTLDFGLSTGNGVTVVAESVLADVGPEPTLTLGSIPVDTDGAHPIADGDLAQGGVTLQGLIGANTLHDYDMLLDAPNQRLLLKPLGPRVEWPGEALSEPIPLRVFHGMILSVELTLDGTTIGAMIDTGSSTVVNPGAGESLGISDEGHVTASIGGTPFGEIPIRVTDHPVLQRFDPDGNGFAILGANVALECALAISWVHAELRTCVR